jgi:hypothetical protein
VSESDKKTTAQEAFVDGVDEGGAGSVQDIALCEQCCGANCKCGCHGESATQEGKEK